MLVLFETAAGYALFKVLDKKKLKNVDALADEFRTVSTASNVVQLADFHKFIDSAEALRAALAVNDGKMDKSLKSLIKKTLKTELHKELLVLDSKLGNSIKSKFTDLDIVCNSSVNELIRCIRGQMDALIPGLTQKEATAMMLGLGHNVSRYKLKFSPDKVDTMVIQAIGLLDELDKELNNYIMRAKEWYGWHFPELAKIVTDNTMYIDTIIHMGNRENAKNVDFSSVLPDDIGPKVKEAAEVSMGCEISDFDLLHMRGLCVEIKGLAEYRKTLFDYLERRMKVLAPSVSIIVGEVIGARLLAHAGSLINLAKNPASTIQLIGAEKALFRALKTKKATPKYGLLYHAELVSQTPTQDKGKMSRMLAAKTALAARVDAIAEKADLDFTIENVAKLRKNIEFFKSGKSRSISRQNRSFNPKPHFVGRRTQDAEPNGSGMDTSNFGGGIKRERTEINEDEQPKPKKSKKDKKKRESQGADADVSIKQEEVDASVSETTEKKKKKKKKKQVDEE